MATEIEQLFAELPSKERLSQIARLVNLHKGLEKIEKNIDKISDGKRIKISK